MHKLWPLLDIYDIVMKLFANVYSILNVIWVCRRYRECTQHRNMYSTKTTNDKKNETRKNARRLKLRCIEKVTLFGDVKKNTVTFVGYGKNHFQTFIFAKLGDLLVQTIDQNAKIK